MLPYVERANFTTKPPIVTITINLKSDLDVDDLSEVLLKFMIERHVTAVQTKAMTVNIGTTQAPVVQKLDSAIHRINHYPSSG